MTAKRGNLAPDKVEAPTVIKENHSKLAEFKDRTSYEIIEMDEGMNAFNLINMEVLEPLEKEPTRRSDVFMEDSVYDDGVDDYDTNESLTDNEEVEITV